MREGKGKKEDKERKQEINLKDIPGALAGVDQLVGASFMHKRVVGLIPHWGTYPGFWTQYLVAAYIGGN